MACREPARPAPTTGSSICASQQGGVVKPHGVLRRPVVGRRQQPAVAVPDKLRPAALDRQVIVGDVEDRIVEIMVDQHLGPVEAVDCSLLGFRHRVAQVRSKRRVPREARGVVDDVLAMPDEKDFQTGVFEMWDAPVVFIKRILADDTRTGLVIFLIEIAIEIDEAVVERGALAGPKTFASLATEDFDLNCAAGRWRRGRGNGLSPRTRRLRDARAMREAGIQEERREKPSNTNGHATALITRIPRTGRRPTHVLHVR